MPDTPYISINPAIQYGQPCIGGTRITTETLAGRVWTGDTVDGTAHDFGLGREAVLLACWYEARFGELDAFWEDWAFGAGIVMNRGGWEVIPDPPGRR